MAFLLRHGRWGVACPRFVRAYAQRVAQYRPLPDPSVAWRADEAQEARRVALQRHMPFAEADHTDADPSVTMQPIDDMTSSTPEHDASAKRPRDDGESPDAHVPDDDHGSPKRPRLFVA